MAARKKKTARKKSAKTAKAPERGPEHYRNRIVGYAEVAPADLVPNPLNFREHPEAQAAQIRDALESIGYVDTIIANQRTRHIVNGHLRHADAIAHGEAAVPVLWVDLTEAEERLALSTIDPISELASTDPDQLAALLAQVKPTGGPLDELLEGLGDLALEATVSPSKPSRRRSATQAGYTLRFVVRVPAIADIERAIVATGIANRGDAILHICRSYISDEQETELDDRPESLAPDQLAAALGDSGSGHT